jgi:uncharacterized membrane protein
MTWFETLKHGLDNVVTVGEFCLEVISVICVLLGAIGTIWLAFQLRRQYHHNVPFMQLRIRFGI